MEIHQVQSNSGVVKVDSKDYFESLITQTNNHGYPVFIHFTASWCVPSLAMNSFMEELATTYHSILFLSLDVDEVKEVAKKMEVKAMPTFVLMKDGAVSDKIVGANPDEIRKRIDAHLCPAVIAE